MANHRAAAALLMIASLLVAVALSGADARPTVRRNKAAVAALPGSNTRLTVRLDAHGPGYVEDVAASAVPNPELTDNKCPDEDHHDHDHDHDHDTEAPQPDPTELETESEDPETELCSTCEKPKPVPPCNTCEPEPKQEPELTCNKVHAVREGETCDSVGQCAGLGQDDFLGFNPNICCDNLFVGQWVCLDATCA